MSVLRLVRRQDWGARPAVFEEPSPRVPVTKVFFWYYTPTYHWPSNDPKSCRRIMNEMQRRHMLDLGFSDIAYHFVIGLDGHVYEGRELDKNTPESLENNPAFYGNRIDIAYMDDHLFSDPPSKVERAGFLVADHCVRLKKLHKLYTYTTIREPVVLPSERGQLMTGRYYCREITIK